MKVKMAAKDKLWADLVKERDLYTCQRCFIAYPEGRRQGLHAHHIFGRSRKTTRHMIVNGVSLCFGCHMWAHSNPLEFHERMADRLGWTEYHELRELSLATKANT
jgi:hypothetical protein